MGIKFCCKIFTLLKNVKFILFIILGVCMNSYANDTAKNRRFPAEEYFTGEHMEMGEAIYWNDKKRVEQLLAEGTDVNALSKDKAGFTYLMYSVFLDNRFDIAKLLLQHKADPNLVSKVFSKKQKREVYYLPITFAAERLPIDYMKVLLEYSADPSAAYVD